MYGEAFPATTRPSDVGVVENKFRSQLRLLKVHFRAEQSQLGFAVYKYPDPVLQNFLGKFRLFACIIQGVAEPVATPFSDPNLQPDLGKKEMRK